MKSKKNKKFLIVGLGLIGGSYAKGLKAHGYYVGAISDKQEDIDYAISHSIIDSGSTLLESEYISQFDIVIFALYPSIFMSWIEQNQHLLKSGAIITDVTGVKKVVVTSISKILRDDLVFVPSHPMAGREVSGVNYADENIFKGANFIITPLENNKEEDIQVVEEIATTLGFKNIKRLSIEEHDKMIGFLSQLTHCIAVSLMNCEHDEDIASLTGDSFRDLTRIAKINENMWTELFLMNKDELLEQMDIFNKEFMKLRNFVATNNIDGMKMMMINSTNNRKKFDK